MNCGHYLLDELGEPKPEPDLITWAKSFANTQRRVARDQIGESDISTVFLGTDHSFVAGPPVLWETTVSGGPLDQEQARCAGGREQAKAMHRAMVARVRRVKRKS